MTSYELPLRRVPAVALSICMPLTVWLAAGCNVPDGTAMSSDSTTALGVIEFANSGDDAAQESFRSGVLFMHNFEYEDAATAFREAQEADPNFALAYWGEALTYNHPIWMVQDRQAAMAVLERLGATPEDRASKAATDREKAYMAAVETLYGNTTVSEGKSKEERDDLYSAEMRRLYEAYPEDDEAAAFYALSLLGTAHEGRDFATYMRAAAVVEPIFENNKDHPGAAHYLIHSYDDPVHAPLGLPMARAYSRIAPDAGHAQHMTSHIFVAMGLWDDVVTANEIARDVQNARQVRMDRAPIVCGHYTYWLEYGYLMQGRHEAARDVLDTCYERIQTGPDASERSYFTSMRARYVLDAADFEAADRYAMDVGPVMDFDYEVVTAVSAAMTGDLPRARAIHGRMADYLDKPDADAPPSASVLTRALSSALAMWDGDAEAAVRAVREAARMEAELPYEFGPPAVVKPMYELLGEFLLEAGRHAEAVEAFSTQLDRTPLRTLSLVGLAKAAEAAGDGALATDATSRLEQVWRHADPGVREAAGISSGGESGGR